MNYPEVNVISDAREALFVLLRAHRLVTDALDRRFRGELGLSLAQWEVLIVLSRAPQMRLRMIDVTRQMLVSKSNVTQLVDKLERARLVTREASTTDRRLVYVSPTPQGLGLLERGARLRNQVAQDHLARPMTAGELRAVRSGLQKVIAASAAR